MPLKQGGLNKPEKKDFKQELLERINQQYGPASATVMDKALKNQDKQLDEAMLQGGMTIGDIAKSQNIDWNSFGGQAPQQPQVQQPPQQPPQLESLLQQLMQNQGQVQATGVSQQPAQPTAQQPQKKGNFLYTPFQIDQQSGQVTPASILGGLISQHPQDVLSMVKANQKGGNLSPIEEESYVLNNELKRLQIEQITKTGEVPTKEDLMANIPEEEKEDYLIKPVKQTIRGIVNTVPILERKKTLPAKQLEDLGGFENTQQDLAAVVDRLKTSGLQIGPGFSTRPGAISDMLGQMKGSEFAALKSDIGRNFQSYRKYITGVAAGYPELNLLAPNYPKATDENSVFIKKSIDVMKDLQRNREILLDHYSKGGYAVSKLRKNQEQSQEQPQSQQGWTQDKESRYQELLKKRGR